MSDKSIESNKESGSNEIDGNVRACGNNRFFKKNIKHNNKMVSLDPKTFTGETLDMNGQLFQSIEES